jgi:LmbE family N-acetylglucosaminyl deacetylase
MFKLLSETSEQNSVRQVLCLGAHSDDIEIGCGGTVLKLIEMFPRLKFYWVVFGAQGKRQQEASKSATTFLDGVGDQEIIIKNFRDGFFPYDGVKIKEFFEELKQKVSPDLIFTHFRHDLHQDHRLISDLTWNTFRDHLILEYEIPKYDGDLGNPNLFVHLSPSNYQHKIDYLMSCFETQLNRGWFTENTFAAILRLRGIESNAPHEYAEAFYCRKAVLV